MRTHFHPRIGLMYYLRVRSSVNAPRATNHSGNTAKILILIGLILQAIFVLVVLYLGLVLVFFPLLGGLVLGLAVIGIFWIILVYLFSYRRTADGDYQGARTPTIVFGILSLLTLSLLPAILYIIGYVKLGDAVREAQPAVGAVGMAGAPIAGAKFCPKCGAPNPPDGQFCQKCGAALPH